MSDITGEFSLSDGARNVIAEEIAKQITPISDIIDANQERLASVMKTVDEIKKQNAAQTETLAAQDATMRKFDYWRTSLFGNGTGVPGFLELARKEDKEKYEKLFLEISSLKQDKYREQGKSELLKEQKQELRDEEQRDDAHKTHRLTRGKLWIGIVGSFASGAGVLAVIRPLLHAIGSFLEKVLQ